MTSQTQFLAKLLGLYCIIVAVAMGLNRQAMLEAITALVHDRPLVFIVGIITVFAGLAMVLVHNIWSGGVAQIVVTLTGWITLLKGVLLLLLPPDAAVGLYLGTMHYAQLYYLYVAFSLALGLYLSWAGFRAPRR